MFKLQLVYVKAPAFTGYKSAGGVLAQRISLLEPKAAAAFTRLVADSDGLITFTDVYRSTLTQIDSIARATKEKKRLYAPPTKSGHQYGMSIDVAIDESCARLKTSAKKDLKEAGASRDMLAAFLLRYGFHGIKSERWHFDFLDGHKYVTERINAVHGKSFALDDVAVQRALNRLAAMNIGYVLAEPLAEDGVHGKKTLAAVAAARPRLGILDGAGADAWFRRVLAGATSEVEIVK